MDKLSDREWTVLGALWETGGAELGQLVEALRPATGWNRNTVLTYLTRMEAKGLVSIDKEASPHIYRAMLSREELTAHLEPSRYIGRCPEQVEEFLKEEVEPVLERYPYALEGKTAELKV